MRIHLSICDFRRHTTPSPDPQYRCSKIARCNPEAAVNQLQAWVDDNIANSGVVIQRSTAHTDDALFIGVTVRDVENVDIDTKKLVDQLIEVISM